MAEREDFYSLDLQYMLRSLPERYVTGGDFNCVLTPADCTGEPTRSKALEETLVRRLGAIDSWNDDGARKLYTHFTGHGASRVDRIYLSLALFKLKQSAEIVAAAFTDHNAAAIKLRLEGRWKMNTALL